MLFDQPLQPATIAASNWHMRHGSIGRKGNVVTTAGNYVTGTTSPNVEAPPDDAIKYLASPADVLALDGTPAAAFTSFPMATFP